MKPFLSVLVLVALALVKADLPGDLITDLPGYSGPTPSRQFSGYLTVDKDHGRNLHYWFVESENSPSKDPVVLWLNGGPGCSSLDGFLYEQGPVQLVDNGKGGVNLIDNPQRWNRIANMIFLEAPAGVGFSYSDTPADYNTNDNRTADDNLLALLQFFAGFPEYRGNDLYITGESYAGIYVPTLVYRVMLHNDALDNTPSNHLSLRGFAVGNGCVGSELGACSREGTRIRMDYLAQHGLVSQPLYAKLKADCPHPANPSPMCAVLLREMGLEVGLINQYNILGDCEIGGMPGEGNSTMEPVSANPRGPRIPVDSFWPFSRPHPVGPVECIDGGLAAKYLNPDAVRRALHVKSREEIGNWTVCSDKLHYSIITKSLIPIYPTLSKRYRTLIYNGDADACVPYTGNERWTRTLMESLGVKATRPWSAWYVNGQVAGYLTRYAFNDFTFLTVKGAGHMVPQFKPLQAFAMFKRFLRAESF